MEQSKFCAIFQARVVDGGRRAQSISMLRKDHHRVYPEINPRPQCVLLSEIKEEGLTDIEEQMNVAERCDRGGSCGVVGRYS